MVNKHRCSVCNKFMEKDNSLESGFVVYQCPDRCKIKKFVKGKIVFETVEEYDFNQTTEEWNLIDQQNERVTV